MSYLPLTGLPCVRLLGARYPCVKFTQGCAPLQPKYRGNLDNLIKVYLTAKIIRPSSFSWASPIVGVIEKNEEYIRLLSTIDEWISWQDLWFTPCLLISDLLQICIKLFGLFLGDGKYVLGDGNWRSEQEIFRIVLLTSGQLEWLRMLLGLKK